MEGKVKKAFPGGNTSQGSYSFFDYIIPENVKEFLFKGWTWSRKILTYEKNL